MTSMLAPLFAPVLVIHIGSGLFCVLAGLVPLFSRKGGDVHRLSGRIYALAMAVLLAGAWIMTAIRFSPYFLSLTAMATLGLFSGLRVLGRKRPDIRPADRAKALDWIVTALTFAVSVVMLYLTLFRSTGGGTAVSAALAGAGIAYGVYDLWRFAAPAAWPFTPQLWLYEHLVKMLGAYSAVWAAFSGNFMTFIPTPWSQLWPSMVFQAIALSWLTWLSMRRRKGAAAL